MPEPVLDHRALADTIKYLIITLLYYRGIYDPDYFLSWDWYGQSVYEIFEPQAQAYLNIVVATTKTYLLAQQWVRVLTVFYNNKLEPIERWEMNIRRTRKQQEQPVSAYLTRLFLNVKATSAFTQTLDPTYKFKVFIYIDPLLEATAHIGLSREPVLAHPNGLQHSFWGLRGPYDFGLKFEACDD